MMLLLRILSILLLSCCFSSSDAEASTVIKISQFEMVKRARLIIRGKVISQKTHRVGPRKSVVTDSVVRVLQYLKGKTVVNLVTVRVEGGDILQTVSGVRQIVHYRVGGGARLQRREEVVLFLEAPKATSWDPTPTYFRVLNMGLGKFTLYPNAKSSEIMIVRQADVPAQITQHSKPHKHRHSSPVIAKPKTFQSFARQIGRHLKVLRSIHQKVRTKK